MVAERLNNATLVKTLNHVGYHELESFARPHGSLDRRSLSVWLVMIQEPWPRSAHSSIAWVMTQYR